MKFKMNMLLAAALLLTSCSQKPDSTTSLYAFETAETARKSWINQSEEPQAIHIPEAEIPKQIDTLRTDTIIENLQN